MRNEANIKRRPLGKIIIKGKVNLSTCMQKITGILDLLLNVATCFKSSSVTFEGTPICMSINYRKNVIYVDKLVLCPRHIQVSFHIYR